MVSLTSKIYTTGWAKKRGHRLIAITLSIDCKIFLIGRFLVKFAVERILKIPPHLAYVATLPCETLMSAKQALNDKLQGSVAAYLRCGGVVNNQIKKGLLLSVWVKSFLIGEYLAKLQARAWLSHALCAPGQLTAKRRRKCTRQSRSCFNFAKYSQILIFFSLADSAINLS